MLATGSGLFVQVSTDAHKRILHPAKVKESGKGIFTVEMDEPGLEFTPGQDIVVFYDLRGEFVQQVARVSAVLTTAPRAVFGFETMGAPVSAESRQCYRVSTVVAELMAKVGEEDNCPLLDVSATGFSVMSSRQYPIGASLAITLRFDGVAFSGTASVLSVKELAAQKWRYGLHCLEERKPGGNHLKNGLRRISMEVQRQHLRRRAGA